MKKNQLKHPERLGATLTELVVAGGLLVTALGLVATTVAAGSKLQRVEREQMLAVDELSLQLEQLISATPDTLALTLGQLQVSPWAQEALDGAKLTGDLVHDDFGSRVELRLDWNRWGGHAGETTPLIAVGWLSERSSDVAATQEASDAN